MLKCAILCKNFIRKIPNSKKVAEICFAYSKFKSISSNQQSALLYMFIYFICLKMKFKMEKINLPIAPHGLSPSHSQTQLFFLDMKGGS